MSKVNSKFRVGDKVKIVQGGYGFLYEFVGQIVEITEVKESRYYGDTGYKVTKTFGEYGDGDGGFVGAESFELVERKSFLKEDLRTGMRVVTRNGETRVVMLGTAAGDVTTYSSGFCYLESYSDSLEIYPYVECTSEYDIDEVYEEPGPAYLLNTSRKGRMLWKRETLSPEQKRIAEIVEQMAALAAEKEALLNNSR